MDKAATILKRDALGRVTHTREQREALLDEFERSGMKGRPFARMAGVSYPTFATWIQKRRHARGDYARKEPRPAPRAHSAAVRLVELALPARDASALAVCAAPPPEGSAAPLDLILPGGARLLLTDTRQAELAAHLLRALNTPPLPVSC